MDFHLFSRFPVGLFIGQHLCEKDNEKECYLEKHSSVSFPVNVNIFITCSKEVRTNSNKGREKSKMSQGITVFTEGNDIFQNVAVTTCTIVTFSTETRRSKTFFCYGRTSSFHYDSKNIVLFFVFLHDCFFLKEKALSDAQLKLSYLECNRISN